MIAPTFSDGVTPNKSAMIREAIANGHGTPKRGCDWIKSTYVVDVFPGTFSVVKSAERRKPRMTRAREIPMVQRGRIVKNGPDVADQVTLVEVLKRLCGRMGKDRVKRVLELIG